MEMLDFDAGSRYVGEFAIGTNYQIDASPATSCWMKRSVAASTWRWQRLSRDRQP